MIAVLQVLAWTHWSCVVVWHHVLRRALALRPDVVYCLQSGRVRWVFYWCVSLQSRRGKSGMDRIIFPLCFLNTFIMVVACEKLLNRRSLQLLLILLHLFWVFVFPLRVGVLRVEVVFWNWWDEWRSQRFAIKLVPIHILQPYVIFNLFRAIQPKSSSGLSLNQSVNKISRILWPTRRGLCLFNLNLFS